MNQAQLDHFVYSGIYPLIGWILHYLPFVAMARVTYVHHYYPALYFAILVAGFCIDWTTRPLSKQTQWALYGVLYVALAGLFWYFRAICFGMVGSADQWRHLRWLSSWRVCDGQGGGYLEAIKEGFAGLLGMGATGVGTASGNLASALSETLNPAAENATASLKETVSATVS